MEEIPRKKRNRNGRRGTETQRKDNKGRDKIKKLGIDELMQKTDERRWTKLENFRRKERRRKKTETGKRRQTKNSTNETEESTGILQMQHNTKEDNRLPQRPTTEPEEIDTN